MITVLILGHALAQNPTQVSRNYLASGFSFPYPSATDVVTESANGQVYFVELRCQGQESAPAYLKLFSVPNQSGAVDAETLFNLSIQEFANLAAPGSLAPGPITEGFQTVPSGEAVCRSQTFSSADGATVARARAVVLQTTPMAAGAMIWLAPGQPESLLSRADTLLSGIQVLPFAEDALQPGEKYSIGYATPLLWIKQVQEANSTFLLSCQGGLGTVFVSGGQPSLVSGELAENLILGAQPADANQVAAQAGGTVMRQNALMRLVDGQLQVGQRFLIALPGGARAEIRNAIFSNSTLDLCLVGGLYPWENRQAMISLLDRMLKEVSLPERPIQEIEMRAGSGISIRFPERLKVSDDEPSDLIPRGWTFSIPHDNRPSDHSFNARIWREDPPTASIDPRQELQSCLVNMAALWQGATVQESVISESMTFGEKATVLQATLLVDGAAIAVDARIVATEHGNFRSIAHFPADLQDDHRPVLNFILQNSALWESGQFLTTSSGAKVRLPDSSWRLRDYRQGEVRAFTLSNTGDDFLRCEPDLELTPDLDLAELMAQEYFAGDLVEERFDLEFLGGKLPGLQSSYEFEEDAGETRQITLHTLFVADGMVWHLSATGPAEDRPLLLAVLAGIELPNR